MYLIDGHNLVHAIRKLDADFEILTEFGLCQLLTKFLRRVKSKGRIVFDGSGPPERENFKQFRILDVRFSGPYTDADTLIEEYIEKNTHPRRLHVVSSDRRLRKAASRRRAISVKSDLFWFHMIDVIRQSPRKPAEPREKYDGIPEGQTDWWMRVFGLGEDS